MRRVDLPSFPLTSHCVRFAFRMPPVWLRRSVSKWRSFSVFAFDYPLVCNWFSCGYRNGFRLEPPAECARPLRSQRWNLICGLVAIASVILPIALVREATASYAFGVQASWTASQVGEVF